MKRARGRKPAVTRAAKKTAAPKTAKKADSKQIKYTYDDIDVPDILSNKRTPQQRPTPDKTVQKNQLNGSS